MLPFAALGWITPVWAAVGMSVSSLTVVLNALRLTRLPSAPPPHATNPPATGLSRAGMESRCQLFT
jgi:hypothetical protein